MQKAAGGSLGVLRKLEKRKPVPGRMRYAEKLGGIYESIPIGCSASSATPKMPWSLSTEGKAAAVDAGRAPPMPMTQRKPQRHSIALAALAKTACHDAHRRDDARGRMQDQVDLPFFVRLSVYAAHEIDRLALSGRERATR